VFEATYDRILHELAEQGIQVVDETELSPEQGHFVRGYFRREVRPMLTPLMIGSRQKFPDLHDKSIYLATRLRTPAGKNDRFSLIEVPTDVVPRFLILPRVGRSHHVILLENVIRYNLADIFSLFEFDSIESHIIKLTRDAELDLDDDVTESYIHKVVKGIKQREEGNPVRIVYDRAISAEFLYLIVRKLGLKDEDSFVPGGRTHNYKDFIGFPHVGKSSLLYSRLDPVPLPRLEASRSVLQSIREKEFLLHFPYQPFDYVIDLLREAAIDPKVTAIKVTLYRIARHSGVANALVNAARNGKDVTAIIELQARFDEQANVDLANLLQEEGAHVIFGVPGLKVHAKLGLILRKERGKTARYAFLGTGNFNEDTAKVYSDHCLFTNDRRLTKEVEAVFAFLQDNYRVPQFKHLLVAPFGFREQISRLIRAEIRNAKKGKEAYIDLKLNNLADPDIVGLLYQAADAGVRLRLNVRGMYSLLPDQVQRRENIESIGLIDRYLEHSRVFVFANGGNEKIFLSSGDLMIRNLERRVEVTFPVYDPALREEIKEFMEIQFRDNVKARILDQELSNKYRPRQGEAIRCQTAFYELLRSRVSREEETPEPRAMNVTR
ncbi:MAG TPA: polyphosphate kinase 1, partial [Vicinamibacteria bacterium]|nr:polyphosphate kinase 1 [Vicinamibacteria bacterium]